MAPTKKEAEKSDKEAKLTSDESAALMLDYLRKQNRPYSATDISANLKNRVTKAAAAKLLKDMHERGEIEGRASGKQIVYHAVQSAEDGASVEELHALEAETTRLKEATITLKQQDKELRLSLRERSTQIPIAELRATIETLEGQKLEMTDRLELLRGGAVKPVSREERDQVDIVWRKWQKIAAARKKIRNELWAEVAGIVEKGKLEETKESLGLEF